MEKTTRLKFRNMGISDVRKIENVSYNDEELLIIDRLSLPKFKPSKLEFNVALLCIKGWLNLRVAGEPLTVRSGQALVCHSQVLITEVRQSRDFDCRVLCVNDRILRNILQAQVSIWNFELYQRHGCVLNVEKEHTDIYRNMAQVFYHEGSPFKHEILICLLRATFLMLCERLAEAPSHNQQEPINDFTRSGLLFQQFLENIQRRRVKKLNVAKYAQELNVTPKYLSTICMRISGKSPLKWITEGVVRDICEYLKNTDLSSKEIAEKLGFSTPSFFGKFVRDQLGCTCTEYRKKTKS